MASIYEILEDKYFISYGKKHYINKLKSGKIIYVFGKKYIRFGV